MLGLGWAFAAILSAPGTPVCGNQPGSGARLRLQRSANEEYGHLLTALPALGVAPGSKVGFIGSSFSAYWPSRASQDRRGDPRRSLGPWASKSRASNCR
jgi:hypothetical protein